VATGSTVVTTKFTLPAGKSLSDLTSVVAIANGIPSSPYTLHITPNVTAAANQTAVEGTGQSFNLGSFCDPDGSPWNVDVNWGDSTSDTTFSTGSAGTLTAQNHTYSEEGKYTVTVTVTDGTNLSGSATFQVTVSDPAVVQGSAVTLSPVEGAAFTGSAFATFTDPGGAETSPDITSHYSVVSIDWGDSTGLDKSSGSISFSGSQGSMTDQFTVSGSHTYGEEGPYTITAIIDHEGVQTTLTTMITVSDPAVGQASAITITPVEGAAFTGSAFATFTDPGGSEPNPSDPTAGISNHYNVVSIDWGDSTGLDTSSGAISFSGGQGSTTDPFTVSGGHTYGEEGKYTITAIIDHEGVQTTLTSTAIVSDPAVLAAGVDVMAKECIAFNLPVATFTDPGGAEPNSSDPTPGISNHYTASVDFGDGKGAVAAVITYNGIANDDSKTNTFTVTASHTFDEEGTFTITTTINHESIITVAHSKATVRDNYGLLLLDTKGAKALTVTGNGRVTVNNCGAVVVDSSDPTAIFLTGNAVVTATEADVGIGGGAVTTNNAVLNLLEPEFNHEAATPDPVALPLPPAPAVVSTKNLHISSGSVTLSPGTYIGGILVDGTASVSLLPGVYYMKGGGFLVSSSGSVSGKGVLLVNAPAKATDVISITGQGSVSLTASSSLPGAYAAYDHIVIFQDPASTNTVTVTGTTASLTASGTLYAPAALLKIDGNGAVVVSTDTNPTGGQVIVFDAKVATNGVLTINADPPDFIVPASASNSGGSAAAVSFLVPPGITARTPQLSSPLTSNADFGFVEASLSLNSPAAPQGMVTTSTLSSASPGGQAAAATLTPAPAAASIATYLSGGGGGEDDGMIAATEFPNGL
jgi:hypothetical protein